MSISALINPEIIISTLGTIGVITIIFLETGAFFGFFFPGDTLLFTAGFLSIHGYVSLPVLLIGACIAAIVGDTVGYAFGKKIGPALFTKENSIFFDKKHITRAQAFYEVYGKKTIIFARFLPVIRTFAPILAGVGNMEYRTFFIFNVIGACLWTWSMLLLGFAFGSVIPNPDRYIIPVIVVIIIISALPALREIFKKRKDIH